MCGLPLFVSSCPPSFWMSGLGCPSFIADKCKTWGSSQLVYVCQKLPAHRQVVAKNGNVQKSWRVSMRRGKSSCLWGNSCWSRHCVGIWWRICCPASLMSIACCEVRTDCLPCSKQIIALPVEITDLRLRKAPELQVHDYAGLISRDKSIAKVAHIKLWQSF